MYALRALLITLFTLAPALGVFGQTTGTTTLTYNPTGEYDDPTIPADQVACTNFVKSFGPNIGSVPNFPMLGGVFTVTGRDASKCGTCYAVTYNENTINVWAVDTSNSDAGFTVSMEAMDTLSRTSLGTVQVTFQEVDSNEC